MSDIECRFIDSLHALSPADWHRLHNDDNPTIDYRFLAAMETSRCVDGDSGWRSSHAILSQNDHIIAAVPLYIKDHPYGEYIFDYAIEHTYHRLGLAYYPKLLAAVPFTPVPGQRLLTKNSNKLAIYESLLQALRGLTHSRGYSGFHFNFIPPEDVSLLQTCGMRIRKTHQYRWCNRNYKNFDDFLNRLSARKRKNIKKERTSLRDKNITFRALTGHDITPAHMDIFYQFYCLTYDKKWGYPYLNRSFFRLIADTMADKILLVLGEQEQETICGALNFIGKDRLIGRNWGCSRAEKFLHFEACYYQALDFACAHGLQWVEAGTQGEHKLQRGYEPVITYSAHYLADERLHNAYGEFLQQEAESIEALTAQLHDYTPYRRGAVL